MSVFAAVDVGASGGRVMTGVVADGEIELAPAHRFPNGVVPRDGHLRWDVGRILDEVRAGLAKVPAPVSVGIDTWAVDYGLLDAEGRLLADPIAHRDDRTASVVDVVHGVVPAEDLFAINGLQVLPFTTIYQLAVERRGALWDRARHVALIPDLLVHRLTGALGTELTNASTTGLLDVSTRDWSPTLLDRLGVDADRLPAIEPPGRVRGHLPDGTPVVTVGSHDTASAVVAVPATTDRFGYVVSGTWSLVGVELEGPLLTEAARTAGFANEVGVDGRIRFLRNVGGLWLLQESMRAWGRSDLDRLLAEAAALGAGGPQVDADDPGLIAPGGMPGRIGRASGRSDLTPAETVRCILDSLAAGHARTLQRAVEVTGRDIDVVHVVGGGAQNELLCQLTADAVERPVLAGPVEATAMGNVAVQARARGDLPGDLEAIRRLVATSTHLRRYEPRCR